MNERMKEWKFYFALANHRAPPPTFPSFPYQTPSPITLAFPGWFGSVTCQLLPWESTVI